MPKIGQRSKSLAAFFFRGSEQSFAVDGLPDHALYHKSMSVPDGRRRTLSNGVKKFNTSKRLSAPASMPQNNCNPEEMLDEHYQNCAPKSPNYINDNEIKNRARTNTSVDGNVLIDEMLDIKGCNDRGTNDKEFQESPDKNSRCLNPSQSNGTMPRSRHNSSSTVLAAGSYRTIETTNGSKQYPNITSDMAMLTNGMLKTNGAYKLLCYKFTMEYSELYFYLVIYYVQYFF